MTYNTSEIMKTAWRNAKNDIANMGYARHQLRELFVYYLRLAWAAAKKAASSAKMTAKEISFQIMRLECKDTLQVSDFKKLDDLHAAHRVAFDREATETKLAA